MLVDITNEVYDALKTTLVGVTVLQAYPATTPVFPCVVVEEGNNINFPDTHDSAGDHHSDSGLQINIFSNSENKISEVKQIRNVIDTLLAGTYNLNRDESQAVENLLDTSIYRYVLRYSYLVDSNKTIYRR